MGFFDASIPQSGQQLRAIIGKSGAGFCYICQERADRLRQPGCTPGHFAKIVDREQNLVDKRLPMGLIDNY